MTRHLFGVSLITFLLLQTGLSRPKDDDDYYANDDTEGLSDEDYQDAELGPPPKFLSSPMIKELLPGDTVELPCLYQEEQPADGVQYAPLNRMWHNGSVPITADDRKMSNNPKISLKDSSLVITGVLPEDSNTYSCVIFGANQPASLNHTIHVYDPPKIVSITPQKSDSVFKLHENRTLRLACHATGYPTPSIKWVRQGTKTFPSGSQEEKGSIIEINPVARHHAGRYDCVATSSYGSPDTKTVNIHVHFSPEVKVEEETVNSGVGYKSEIVCIVHAEPKAHVEWYKNKELINPSGRVNVTSTSTHKYVLTIEDTNEDDFDTYTCRASNAIGRNQKSIKLTASPGIPKFHDERIAMDGSGLDLEWTVESHSPILKYVLRYRKKDTEEWTELSPKVSDPEGHIYHVMHTVPATEPGVYEAILISSNAYGESKSNKYAFTITGDPGTASPRGDPDGQVGGNGVENTRPRLMAVLTIFSLGAFFL